MGKLAMIEQRDSRDRLRQRIKGLLGLGQLPEQQLLAVLPDVPPSEVQLVLRDELGASMFKQVGRVWQLRRPGLIDRLRGR